MERSKRLLKTQKKCFINTCSKKNLVRGVVLNALKRIRNETKFWEKSIYYLCSYPPFQTYLSKIYPNTYVLLNLEKRNTLHRSLLREWGKIPFVLAKNLCMCSVSNSEPNQSNSMLWYEAKCSSFVSPKKATNILPLTLCNNFFLSLRYKYY